MVYEVTWEICQATYIGSTIRPLHDGAKEHVAAAKKRNRTSAVGEHYERHHRTGDPKLRFRIVYTTGKDELRLRIVEAMTIRDKKTNHEQTWRGNRYRLLNLVQHDIKNSHHL